MRKSQITEPPGTFEYVVRHAAWQASRGRNPSAQFPGIPNPRLALEFCEEFAYFPKTGVYLEGVDLSAYRCSSCGASGVRLWRRYQSFDVDPQCATCLRMPASAAMGSGNWECRVPAIPDEDFAPDWLSYWGYMSVPAAAYR